MLMVSLYTIAAVAGLALYAGVRERGWSWLWAALACPIALESFFLGGQLLRWASAVNHFTLSD
jgi:hypothetical protein